jgi:hypothetical protein
MFRVLEPPSEERRGEEDAIREIMIPGSEEGSAPDLITRRHRSLDVRGIDWLSTTHVHAETTACFGYDPCFITMYELERRGGQWIILSEYRPPAL